MPAAAATGGSLRAWPAAIASTRLASFASWKFDGFGNALCGFFKIESHVNTNVGAAPRPASASATPSAAAAKQVAEDASESLEDVFDVVELMPAHLAGGMAKPVVPLALVPIGKHLV